ncbi:MAG: energy transducer TonB [Hyphomonadaceae bacterium]
MRHANIRRLMVACAAVAGLLTAAMPAAAQTTSDPTMRPNTPLPAYPTQSRKAKEAGVVQLKLCVEADGRVSKADVSQTSGYTNLDNAVLKWVKGIQLNPAMKGSTPVALCDFGMSYEFQVTKGPTQQPQTNNPFDIGPVTGAANGP